jgi:hypothetical protein
MDNVALNLKDEYKFTYLHRRLPKHKVAFEEWRRSLGSGCRLPRGKFFAGKKPEGHLACPIIWDEFSSYLIF